jgi:hypothetical protein
MRRFAYWLFPLTAAAVAVFIVVFLVRINAPIPASHPMHEEREGGSPLFSATRGSWMEGFSLSDERGYAYPLNEVHLELDTGGDSSPGGDNAD